MNLIDIKEDNKKTIFKLLGLTLFSKEIDKAETVLKIKLLSGLLYFKYDIFFRTYNFKLFGITIFRTKLLNSYRIVYFLFLPIWFENVNKKSLNYFLDSIINKYPQYNDYYIFLSRSGEFFLLMHHLKEWLTKNGSHNYILVFTARYHLNICKMFFPDVPMVYIKKVNVPLVSRGVKSIHFEYKTKNIYVPTNEKYFVQVEKDIRDKNGHYYELLKQHLNLSDKTGTYAISLEAQRKAQNIVKYILKNKFVFISPETLSNEPMEKDFWDNLTVRLKNLGYEVFCNAMEFKNLADESTSTFLTYEESIELAKYAKVIIGMRSGFLECLSQNNVPLFALYTDFPERTGFKRLKSDKVLSGFSITKLPNVNTKKITEIDVSKYDDENLIIEKIISNIAKGEFANADLETFNCCGCASCANICPVNAIKMVEDKDGFYIPSVDKGKCTNCDLCRKICPQLNDVAKNTKNPKCYATMASDEVRQKSSSGGAFSVIAHEIFNRGGVVCGAAFDENWTVRHIIIENENDMKKLRGSKYVQSFVSEDLYQKLKTFLESNRWVMFTGTPCQVAGLKAYLGEVEYEKLLLVDLVCSRVPSKKVFDKFLNDNYDKSEIRDIKFRDKSEGWKFSVIHTTTTTTTTLNDYFRLFHSSLLMCNSCNECKYTTHDRVGDITIGDFWGIWNSNPELNDNKGLSCVILNNKKGELFFYALKWKLKKHLSYKIATRGNKAFNSCFKHHPLRNTFAGRIDNENFNELVAECLSPKYKVGIINWWFVNNRGAILTNYALNEMVRELGYDAYTINYIIPASLGDFDNNIASKFANKYLKRTRFIKNRNELSVLNNDIGTFIVGSDQVFNYRLAHAHQDIFYMDWVSIKNKLLAYSASFGIESFKAPFETKINIKNLFKRFDHISVRELDGVDILRDTFNIDAVQVMDPVFCIDKEKYDRIIENANCQIEGDYIADYFIWKSEETDKLIEQCKTQLGIDQVIHLKDVKSIEEFLFYIKNAKFVIGDSFHGTCFAIIFNKPFATRPPYEHPSRFLTLDKLFGMSDRYLYKNKKPLSLDINSLKEIDWKEVNNKIQNEVTRSKNWLKNVLDEAKNTNLSDIQELYECILIRDKEIAKLETKYFNLIKHIKYRKYWLMKLCFYRIFSNFTFGKLKQKLVSKKHKYKDLLNPDM